MATSVVFPRVQFFANNGRPLIGGRIHTYVAGSSTRARTYKDAAKAQPNTNPIILDGRGEAQIYLAEGVEYKFVVEDSKGALIYTQEPVYGAVWPNAAEWPSDATLSYQYMMEAKAAAGAIGPIEFYDTRAQAQAAASSLPSESLIEVSQDETKAGARTRYRVRGGALVFLVNLDQLRVELAALDGASRIGFKQAGANATVRTVQEELRRTFTVEQFGAVGDGVTDDSAAFQKSQVQAGRAAIFVRSDKTYVLNGTFPGRFYSTGFVRVIGNANIEIKNITPVISRQTPPSLPTLGTAAKLILAPGGVGDAFYVVTRMAQGKTGWIAVKIGKEVSPVDSENTGGESNFRPQSVLKLIRAFVAKTGYRSKSAGTVLSGLPESQLFGIWGASSGGGSSAISSDLGLLPYSFSNKEAYNCAGVDEYIDYSINYGARCTLRLGMTNGSSESVAILVSANGADFFEYMQVSLKQPPSGTATYRDVPVQFNSVNPWYVRVINKAAGSCLVVGVNVGILPETAEIDIDCAQIITAPNIGGESSNYQISEGANEWAARPVGGKWFGTYHGGHSNFLERLRLDLKGLSTSYDLRATMLPKVALTRYVHLHSTSQVGDAVSSYNHSASCDFGDGAYVLTYSLNLRTGYSPAYLGTFYTHMCTTAPNFSWVHLPKAFEKTDDGSVAVGSCSFIQQYRASDGAHINCYFSEVDVSENGAKGMRIAFLPMYNKQYYGPALDSIRGVPLISGQWVTAKEYF